eukprot:TRINITY_DN57403_c0_g1_i1.p1 TRINITY_DN57403_c0_g1~~TRINITY_DN57403_c0_g1_i1.p1  ORF type:complete len:443 (+),score=51.40 TRINITY_DN57403_c0_g1_i1:54-1331(+)
MLCPTWRAPFSLLTALLLWQSSLVASLFVLLPAVPLLFLPTAKARSAFERWASWWKAAWLSLALLLIRFVLGIQIVLHVHGGVEDFVEEVNGGEGSALVVANHRTALCWAWLFGLASFTRRLRDFKIVLMDSMKHLPGFGWAMQCFGFAFIKRNLGKGRGGGESELAVLRKTIEAHEETAPLMLLLFPEGRDLNPQSIAASNAYADKQDPQLPHYTQVLHPKTGGFIEVWETMCRNGNESPEPSPILIDTTIAYVDYQPGEIPKPLLVFLLGRCPSQVHIAVEVLEGPATKSEADAMCKQLFEEKERRLSSFYSSSPSNLASLLSCQPSEETTAYPNYGSACVGLAALVGVELLAFGVWYALGTHLFWMLCGVESLAFVALGMCGGVDTLLLWHAARWQHSPWTGDSSSSDDCSDVEYTKISMQE